MKVVKNWKNLWKSLTVQVSAIGLVLTQVLYTIPSWEALPIEIPPEYVPYISSFFFLAAILARVKYQPTLHKELDKEE